MQEKGLNKCLVIHNQLLNGLEDACLTWHRRILSRFRSFFYVEIN
jgi:hypothetical protein